MKFLSNYKKFVFKGFIGDIISTLITTLTSLSLVNYLDDVLYGSYIYGVAIALPLITLTSISGESVILSNNNEESKKDIFYTRIRISIFIFPILFIISYFDTSNAIPWFLLTFIYFVKLQESISRLLYSYLYLDDRIKEINYFKISNQLLIFIGLGIISPFTQSITNGLIFTFLLRILLLVIQINGIKHYLKFDKAKLFKLHIDKKYFVLGSISFLTALNISIPKIISQNIYGVEFMSVLGAILLVPSFVEVIFTSVNKSIRNRLSKMVDEFLNIRHFIFKVLTIFFISVLAMGITLFLFQDYLYLFLSARVIGNLQNILFILFGVPLLVSSYNFYFLLIKLEEFKMLLKLQIVLTFVSFSSSYYFINQLGLEGFSINYIIFALFSFFLYRNAVLRKNLYG